MDFREFRLILPCHSWEDFPVHWEGPDAASLLASWSSLWHPALLNGANSLPTWVSADDPPSPSASSPRRLLVAPDIARDTLSSEWLTAAERSENMQLLPAFADRREMLAAVLSQTESAHDTVDPELVDAFFALAYGFLQHQLLQRRMGYASLLDRDQFTQHVLAAASAAVCGEDESSRAALQSGIDLLIDARNHYYPVDFYLIDLALTSSETLPQLAAADFACGWPRNVVASGSSVDELARSRPDVVDAWRRGVAEGNLSVLGSGHGQMPLDILSCEGALGELREAQDTYRRHLDTCPTVFASFEFSLAAHLPQLLRHAGYDAALHVAFDGSGLPRSPQSRILWTGIDGTEVNALAATPIDWSDAGQLLRLHASIADAMEGDHVATVLMAGWPGHESVWYEDLCRISAFGPLLGKFHTLEEYFAATEYVGAPAKFAADAYRSRRFLSGDSADSKALQQHVVASSCDLQRAVMEGMLSVVVGSATADAVPARLPIESYAQYLASEDGTTEEGRAASEDGQGVGKPPGQLLVNPTSIDLTATMVGCGWPPTTDSADVGCEWYGDQVVPACGFLWQPQSASPSHPVIVEALQLTNRYLSVVIDEQSGGIRAIRRHRDRKNRLSQRLALVSAGETDAPAATSPMVADEISVVCSDSRCGAIRSNGRLFDAKRRQVASWRQLVRLPIDSRLVFVDTWLDLEVELEQGTSYVANRLALSGSVDLLRRGLGGSAIPTSSTQFVAQRFVEGAAGAGSFALFAPGMMMCRRHAERQLDLRQPMWTSQTPAAWAIGLDVDHPAQIVRHLLTSGPNCSTNSLHPKGSNRGWFFHFSADNVALVSISPDDSAAGETGELGVRLRVQELEGRRTRGVLRCFRQVESAQLVDWRQPPLPALSMREGDIELELGGYQLVELMITWA